MNSEQINAIYDCFGKKDMTRSAFHTEMRRLADPKRLADEAHDIAVGNMNRRAIDKKIHAGDL